MVKSTNTMPATLKFGALAQETISRIDSNAANAACSAHYRFESRMQELRRQFDARASELRREFLAELAALHEE